MKKLVLQIIIRQWDKSQLSEQHTQARKALPDRYLLSSSALAIAEGQVLLDQQGNDLSGNRIGYQLTEDNAFLIDRFRFDLDCQTVEFKSTLQANEPPKLLATLDDDWIQCQYEWRYRVDEGGFIYWRYENMILNACFAETVHPTVFTSSAVKQIFDHLLSS